MRSRRWREGGCSAVIAQIQRCRIRQHRIAPGVAKQRRIPAAAVVGKQRIQGWWHHAADAGHGQFAGIARILQVGVHRQPGQHRVLQLPGAWLLAQQQVGPGPYGKGRQAGVDAVAIGFQHGAFVAQCSAQVFLGMGAQPVHPHALVQGQGLGTEQLGQFSRCRAPHQVHFKETLLGMHIAQRPRHVGLVGRVHGQHAQGVALDGDRCRQARQGQFSIQLRQAAAQQAPEDQQ